MSLIERKTYAGEAFTMQLGDSRSLARAKAKSSTLTTAMLQENASLVAALIDNDSAGLGDGGSGWPKLAVTDSALKEAA